MSDNTFLSNLIGEIGDIYNELEYRFDGDSFNALAYYMGWETVITADQLPAIRKAIGLDPLLDDLTELIDDFKSTTDAQQLISPPGRSLRRGFCSLGTTA